VFRSLHRWCKHVRVDRPGSAWARSGAMALTGRAEGAALGAPVALVALAEHAAALLHARTEGRVAVDGLALLGERAALGDLARHGDVSCGGGTRLLRAADGWIAVSLARPDDIESLPAWLECPVPADDPWTTVKGEAAVRPVAQLDERAALLGLPIAGLATVAAMDETAFGLPIVAHHIGSDDPEPRSLQGANVVDLSALWAGPLCGQLLGVGGATVVKVEAIGRPDGARRGPSSFFDLLNGGKQSVALDFHSVDGLHDLRRFLGWADVVIESARPRALEQMGMSAADLLGQADGPRAWVSITSHGRAGEGRQRVGFGDVAAVAGGLVVHDDEGPCFIADAVTDPLAGLVAAAAAAEALAAGGHWLLSVAMAPLAASVAGEPMDVDGLMASNPSARPLRQRAPDFGADTGAVLAGLPALVSGAAPQM
jgi:CoA transferase family III